MAECKTCGKKFHTCSSCDLHYDWESNYCSDTCWKGGEEYANDVKLVDDLMLIVSRDESLKGLLTSILNSENAIYILESKL